MTTFDHALGDPDFALRARPVLLALFDQGDVVCHRPEPVSPPIDDDDEDEDEDDRGSSGGNIDPDDDEGSFDDDDDDEEDETLWTKRRRGGDTAYVIPAKAGIQRLASNDSGSPRSRGRRARERVNADGYR
jgi:hypothetical protein